MPKSKFKRIPAQTAEEWAMHEVRGIYSTQGDYINVPSSSLTALVQQRNQLAIIATNALKEIQSHYPRHLAAADCPHCILSNKLFLS